MGEVTSGFLLAQSRTARARFQGIQFAHDNPPNDRCLLACNDEIDYFTIDTADDTRIPLNSMLCCIRLFPYVHLGRTYAQSPILKQSDENPEALVRIGIAEFLSNSWFDGKEDEILTIIWSDDDMIVGFSQDQIYLLYPLILQLELFKEDFCLR